jgi:hypothetical protein
MSYYGDPRIDAAVDRYFRLAKRDGIDEPPMPNHHEREVIGDIVYIRNVNGLLARFSVGSNNSVRRLVTTQEHCDRDDNR